MPDEVLYSEGLCHFSRLLFSDPHPLCASSLAKSLRASSPGKAGFHRSTGDVQMPLLSSLHWEQSRTDTSAQASPCGPQAVLHSQVPTVLGLCCTKPSTQGGMGPTFPWRHCCIPCSLPVDSPSHLLPTELAPQDIYSRFLQQWHVRKAATAFVAIMPCKQRGRFTPPHTPKLLWCWFFKWPPGTLCEQDTHRRAGSSPMGAALQPEPPLTLSTRAPAGFQAKAGCPWEICPYKGSNVWHVVWKAL